MSIKHNVSEIRRLLSERRETMQALIRFLISKGISTGMAEEIATELAHEGKEIGHVGQKLMQRVHAAGELTFDKPRKVALIGPTGVGKTTTLMKLADHYLKMGKQIALTSLDEGKKGGLKVWAEQRNLPFLNAPAPSPADLLLIDTEGCNFYQQGRVEALGESLAECGGGLEVVLTLSAAAKEVDLYGAIHQFSSRCPSTLAFTKLDETLASGVVMNVCAKADIPIRYIAFGYPLPGDIHVADPKLIVNKILNDFNEEEFQTLRQLTL